MSSSYSETGATPKDNVRMLLSDVGGQSGTDWIFSDEEIEAYLTLRSGSVFRAAATALRTIASNEAMQAKVIRFLDISTDGAKLADSLAKAADQMEMTADEAEDDSDFEIAYAANDIFSARSLRGRAL